MKHLQRRHEDDDEDGLNKEPNYITQGHTHDQIDEITRRQSKRIRRPSRYLVENYDFGGGERRKKLRYSFLNVFARPPTKLQINIVEDANPQQSIPSAGSGSVVRYIDLSIKKENYVCKMTAIPVSTKESTWSRFLKPWLDTKKEDNITRIKSTSGTEP
ncbi:hypothetical protein ACOME3_003151 [Neoechinorhynchus agilis]